MKKKTRKGTPSAASTAARKIGRRAESPGDSRADSTIRFRAVLSRPKTTTKAAPSMSAFLILPKAASVRLPSRGMVSVQGTLNGRPFRSTLEPDGKGGHWMKVDRKLSKTAGVTAGDEVALKIAPLAEEPEPEVPPDLRKALVAAPVKAREAWSDITPAARRDFIHWIVSPKRPETRAKRIATACGMLANGKRRPCCFDRSGMYSGSLACPMAEDQPTRKGR